MTRLRAARRLDRRGGAAARGQAGLTLVELMVALVLGLLITAAAVAALLVARRGFTTVDAGAQLRENVRFAASVIQRITVQAGFTNVSYGFFPVPGQEPPLFGVDNAQVTPGASALAPPVFGSGNGINGSDALVVRFFGANASGTTTADGSMINCAGVAEVQDLVELPPDRPAPATSIFHIATSTSGEPTLACTYRDPSSRAWATVALVPGVESLQILYGVDGVTPGAAPAAGSADGVPERYVRASQLQVGANVAATADNWRRVRSIRIGMVVRGAPNSAVDRAGTAQTLAVLGPGFTSAADVGSSLVTTADGRLRQQLVFTVHLRNPQDGKTAP